MNDNIPAKSAKVILPAVAWSIPWLVSLLPDILFRELTISLPGWLMVKSMPETRGFFWAGFIHFWMDAVIFFFIALGSVTPGG